MEPTWRNFSVLRVFAVLFWLSVVSAYQNPVLNRDFPDPCILRASDGTFYVYGTMSSGANIQVAQSTDLVTWTWKGDALPIKPTWASNKQTFWAPDVQQHGNTFYMYFAAEPNNSTSMCIGVATSTTPLGPFKDKGTPLMCGQNFVAIDPKSFDDSDGKIYLFWGSDSAPIRIQELDPNRMDFAGNSAPTALIYPSNTQYRRLIEGAWLWKKNGWYYLYYSGDNCCGPSAEYAVMVSRARSILGPYENSPNFVVLLGSEWVAPGHNSIISDNKAEDWILYHSIFKPEGNYYVRKLLLDHILYDANGWPYVNGRQPSNSSQPNPSVN